METSKKIFITRLTTFLLFALVIPVSYLIGRFDLFVPTSKLQIGLWGIICLGIIVAVVGALIKYYLDGLKTKYSYFKQVLHGLVKLIFPLVVTLVALVFLKDNIDLVIEALLVITPCELIAIFLNPMPKWCFDNNVDGLGEITDKIFFKKQNNNNETKGE